MKERKILIVGGGYLLVQEILDSISASSLPIAKIQIVSEKERVGEIHDFNNQPVPVTDIDVMYEEGYDAAILLSPLKDLKSFTQTMVMSKVPILDMANLYKASSELPVLVPDTESFALKNLPMVAIVPTRTAHALTTILHELTNCAQWSHATVCSIQGAACQGSRQGLDELFDQTRSILGFTEIPKDVFPQQLAFNAFHSSNVNDENRAMCEQSRFLLQRDDFVVSSDILWCGFFVGIIGTVWLHADSEISIEQVNNAFMQSKAVTLQNPLNSIIQTAGSDTLALGNITLVDDNTHCVTIRFAMDNLHRGLSTSLTRLLKKVWINA